MNIAGWTNIPNITNQVKTGAPQAGLRHDPGAAVPAGGGTAQGSARLLQLDLSGRKGYREGYSIQDAAESLWKQETQTFRLSDLEDPEKANEIIENMRRQARWDLGLSQGAGETKDEVLSAYIQELRQNGLGGAADWDGLSRELEAFQSTTPEELEDGLDYLASRYVAVLDKLERNYTGGELAAQRAKLDEVYQAGAAGMIDGYAQLLQTNLGISDSGVQAVKDSFSTILSEKVDAYQGALGKVNEAVSQSGPDSVWLKNHDAYIASQLRAAGAVGQTKAPYSVQDLAAAGQLAQSYRTEIFNASSCGRNEATLALNLSMADMKAETLIEKGIVGKDMAALLRSSRAQGHENALNALDQALAKREGSLAPGEPKGTFAPVDRTVFQGIYQTVMNVYQQNGGNGAAAIRAGASYGQMATAQASARNPQALRWGISSKSYWEDFYKTPDAREATPLEIQLNKLLVQAGQAPSRSCSTYQKYVNSWQDFLSLIGGGVDLRA